MHQTAEFLFALGAILLLGLAADFLGRHTLLPRVTLLLLAGILIGDQALGLIPAGLNERFEIIANMALVMVGFLLGGQLTFKSLRGMGRPLLWISFSASLASVVIVTLALGVFGLPTGIAILLGCIAAATAPAATADTVIESGDRGPFGRLLLAIVAIDDAWALILFSLALAVVSLINGAGGAEAALLKAGHEIFGAVALGCAIGLPAAYLTGRLKPGQPILTEALGLVFLCGGATLWLDVSFLITAMVMGAVISNLATHHDYPFHEIENIEWPVMVVFFMLAGASLEIGMLTELGLVGLVYLLARTGGKISGAWIGARLSHAGTAVERWMGLALLPQAGVAIGMTLIAANRFPEYYQIILSVVISTTVVFELLGPVLTRLALRKSMEYRAEKPEEK
jgi:Kef-type K+ transport system membrane component KefB